MDPLYIAVLGLVVLLTGWAVLGAVQSHRNLLRDLGAWHD